MLSQRKSLEKVAKSSRLRDKIKFLMLDLKTINSGILERSGGQFVA